ncbi:polysaccharide pyruvyl transferase family protein [Streptomyces sp. NPDC048191]|uniref:polysaccharide pyruvyl transferase family protein n=1 Tax=Streptomyces sp. NPDC048191 TaxID=3155484 RepID=UPI0033CFCF28
MNACDFVVTERLHAAILAACRGIPFIYLQTTSKSQDLEHLLLQIGGRDMRSCFRDMETDRSSLIPSYRAISARRSEVSESLSSASGAIRLRLQEAAHHLAGMLTE